MAYDIEKAKASKELREMWEAGRARSDAWANSRKKSGKLKPAAFNRITQDVIDSFQADYLTILYGGLLEESAQNQRYETITREQFEMMSVPDGVDTAIKSVSDIDFAVSSACTLLVQDPQITAETDAAQRIIDEALEIIESKKMPFKFFCDQIASGLFVRGNACVEVVFGGASDFIDLVVVDTKQFTWKLIEINREEGQEWILGQYKSKEVFDPVAYYSPNVRWEAVNPLPGERMGRSPIATAVPLALDNLATQSNLQRIIERHAFMQRVVSLKQLAAAENDNISPEDVDQMTVDAVERLSNLSNMEPNQIPIVTDFMEFLQLEGAGGQLNFIDMLDRMWSRGIFRGVKTPPTVMGSNEFTAESSARSQNLFYSALLTSMQNQIREMSEWAFRRILRSRGNSDDPIFDVKSVDTIARVEEADAFTKIMTGIGQGVQAGMALMSAIALYEEESGNEFSAEVKKMIESEMTEPQERTNGQDEADTRSPSQNNQG